MVSLYVVLVQKVVWCLRSLCLWRKSTCEVDIFFRTSAVSANSAFRLSSRNLCCSTPSTGDIFDDTLIGCSQLITVKMPSSEVLRTLRWLTRSANGVLQQPQTMMVGSLRIIYRISIPFTDNYIARMRKLFDSAHGNRLRSIARNI